MVLAWRRAFCTSISKDQQGSPIIKENKPDPSPSPKLSSRFTGFFSNPSTPRTRSHQSQPVVSSSPNLRCKTTVTTPATNSQPQPPTPLQSPKLQCKTRSSPRFFHHHHHSAPTSPRSPSTFSFLKSSLRLSKSRCGICLHSVKKGQGTAIFTAECGHSFHFPCIAAHVRKQGSLTCPNCSSTWKQMHLLDDYDDNNNNNNVVPKPSPSQQQNDNISKRGVTLKVYNDDEPLSSPTCGARFNPIPESDEENDNDEFPGFFVTSNRNVAVNTSTRSSAVLDIALLSETAVVSVGKTSETYAVVLRIKAPPATLRRAPVDMVSVLDVGRCITPDKLHLMKKMMRTVVSSLSASDRLSIVAFSSTSKRVLPLRRMTSAGKRSSRRIIDAVVSLEGGATSPSDALKKAAKVIEDRREKNPGACILIFSDGHRSGPLVTSTRFSSSEIPVHSVSLTACLNAPPDDMFAKSISGLLSQVMQDLQIQLGFTSSSAPAEISAVYSYTGRPAYLGSGSSWCRVGDLHSEEERELLVELKVPAVSSLSAGAHRLLSVRCSYKEPSTQQTICETCSHRPLLIPRPRAIGSSTRDIQRLRCLFVTTRAVAESRRLAERNDVAGAHHMLASARALILQSGSGSGENFVRGLEAELAELNYKRQEPVQQQQQPSRRNNHDRDGSVGSAGGTPRAEEKVEPLTPTSAWRAAERLAKVAIMRKSLNRVSDLHGFENARF